MQAAEHIAIAKVFNAPVYASSHYMAIGVESLGASTAPLEMHRMAWSCRLRAVMRHSGLVLAMHRLDAAIAQDRCLIPRCRAWLAASTVVYLRVAHTVVGVVDGGVKRCQLGSWRSPLDHPLRRLLHAVRLIRPIGQIPGGGQALCVSMAGIMSVSLGWGWG